MGGCVGRGACVCIDDRQSDMCYMLHLIPVIRNIK